MDFTVRVIPVQVREYQSSLKHTHDKSDFRATSNNADEAISNNADDVEVLDQQ